MAANRDVPELAFISRHSDSRSNWGIIGMERSKLIDLLNSRESNMPVNRSESDATAGNDIPEEHESSARDAMSAPLDLLPTAEPARILWRSIWLLIFIVGVPSIVYNLLLPAPEMLEAVQAPMVVVVSAILGMVWLYLFIYFVSLYNRSWRTEPRFATVLAVLLLDALRNVIESAYFGVAYSERTHLLPSHLMRLLWHPQVIFISRLLALATALVILWLVIERGFENLKLREQRSLLLEQRNRELTALQQLAALVSGSLETQAVLHSICREIVETLSFQSALLCLVDESAGTVRGAAGHGVAEGLIEETQRSLAGSDVLADIVRTGATEVLSGWDDRFNRETFNRFGHANQVRVFSPIRDAQGTLGVVEVTVKPNAPPPDEHRLAMLHSFLRHASTAIRNARLHERVLADRERLNVLTGTLEDKNKQLEAFVYMISHDLKAPLVSIQGFLSLLSEEYGPMLGEDGQFYLGRVRGNAEHLQRLIQQLLELSRIGRVERAKEWIDMDSVVDEIVESLAPRLRDAGIQLRLERPLPGIFGEPTQVREIVMNLLDNSIKYMGESLRREIALTAKSSAADVEFIVSDSGSGIAPEYRERVFQMFQRLPTPGSVVEGNGVGLAIVRKIVETHGGRVWVESEGVGKGSQFHFVLPKGAPLGIESADEEQTLGGIGHGDDDHTDC